jgi:hypothetical protein
MVCPAAVLQKALMKCTCVLCNIIMIYNNILSIYIIKITTDPVNTVLPGAMPTVANGDCTAAKQYQETLAGWPTPSGTAAAGEQLACAAICSTCGTNICSDVYLTNPSLLVQRS